MQRVIFGEDSSWWSRFYWSDWALVLFLYFISGILIVANPRDRYLPPGDPSVTYPSLPDTVPDWLLYLIIFALPTAIFLMIQIRLKSRHDFHHAMLGLFLAIALALVVTVPLKVGVGRYRPDYEARLGQKDARQSFPSGHSSTSFAAMVFVSFYLSGKLRILSDHSGPVLLKGLASLMPLGISIFVSTSRVIDYHHDFSDIIAGCLLGIGAAFFAYFLYFPSLFDTFCHLPKTKENNLLKGQANSPILRSDYGIGV